MVKALIFQTVQAELPRGQCRVQMNDLREDRFRIARKIQHRICESVEKRVREGKLQGDGSARHLTHSFP